MSLIPDWKTKIPHTAGQLTLCTTTRERNPRATTREKPTWGSQDPTHPNKYFNVFKKKWSWSPVAAAAAKSLQSCPTQCDPIDSSPPGCPVPGILQARTLEWVAISFSNAWKWKVKVKSLSRVQLLATPWTAAYQASLSMGFSRQEYWSEWPLPSPSWSPNPQ